MTDEMTDELKELKEYINDLIDKRYKKNCPKWVDYEMFKKEKCDKLVEILLTRDEDDDDDGIDIYSFVVTLNFSFNSPPAYGIDPFSVHNLGEDFTLPERIEKIIIGNMRD